MMMMMLGMSIMIVDRGERKRDRDMKFMFWRARMDILIGRFALKPLELYNVYDLLISIVATIFSSSPAALEASRLSYLHNSIFD